MRVQKRKVGGVVRATWTARSLGVDTWGEWLWVPSEAGALLFPSTQSWVAWFQPDGSVRVDVATDLTTEPGLRWFIDLDLDCERAADGSVSMLDRDDFELRSPTYPRAWVELALEAWREVGEALTERREPFDRAAHRWLARG
ncbi:DUF402 domain-containing protein [Nocardioides limicola]|uniref:DUF402 domain-containing protein n=1 Tax=Nocardioides limicola TaxID=2803368 RepID=UPI00193B3524|nr:DUF402 domain-containing protein [Nocardioides sp. DJM-14]